MRRAAAIGAIALRFGAFLLGTLVLTGFKPLPYETGSADVAGSRGLKAHFRGTLVPAHEGPRNAAASMERQGSEAVRGLRESLRSRWQSVADLPHGVSSFELFCASLAGPRGFLPGGGLAARSFGPISPRAPPAA